MLPIQGEITMTDDTMLDMVPLEIGKDFKLPDINERSVTPDSFSENGSNGIYLSDSPQHCQNQSDDGSTFSRNLQMMRRKKNRLAAQKCREKKKERIRILEEEIKSLIKENYSLKQTNYELGEKLAEQEKKLEEAQCYIRSTDRSHHIENTYQVYHNKQQQILAAPNTLSKNTITDNVSYGHHRHHNSMAPNNFLANFLDCL
ncbi:transcription factor kayak-like isoform X1 [Octopus vulgaris]|uniref:Transcription factor kayak-like isoform X1 n=1 Tax=Octopus vulgaris TaxID=6645 RepID=A0AA36BAN0_OCTVU|nr:transcription factor kayak-like isoform X1 [Octopus vulgaris]